MILTNPTFYSLISSFQDFSEVVLDKHYHDVPDTWHILLTDVKGSTDAIKAGRYKQVNMIGAASITCVVNCLKAYDIPYVFGGDGATVLLPPEFVEIVQQELSKLQALSKKEFNIELRVGLVDIKSLHQMGYKLKIAKYELSPGNYLAQFRGGALTKAEEMIKGNHPNSVVVEANENAGPPNLDGLSCRLNPLKSKKGVILSLLCRPKNSTSPEEVLQKILTELRNILNNDLKSASPVSHDRLIWRWPPLTLKDEASFQKKAGTYSAQLAKTLFTTLIVQGSLTLNYPLGPFQPKKYKDELVMNSDFKKFDETLRMVVDCTQDQADTIENLLESKKDQIYYGTHRSKEALMTCMVFSASQNQHVHFIDGANGGYAYAAIEFKKQIAAATSDHRPA